MHAPTTDICECFKSTRGGCCPVLSWFHPTLLEHRPLGRWALPNRHLCDDFYTKKRKGAIIQLCTFA